MRKTIITLVVALASLVPAGAVADGMPPAAEKPAGKGSSATAPKAAATPDRVTQADLQPDAPDQYTVVKGDTLWGISGRFLKDPWKWPQIWQMNQDQIRNPHRIYPGDVIRLDRSGGDPRLTLNAAGGTGAADASANVVKMDPRVRVEPLETSIPTIPGAAIAPFLARSLIIEADGLNTAPAILATEEERVVIGAGDTAYADRISSNDTLNWQIYRPGTPIRDLDTNEILGYEAKYIGDARVRKFGNPTTLHVLKARQEVNRGDRLQPAREVVLPNYVPHAPSTQIQGRVLAVDGGVSEFGQWQIVTLNRGTRDGISVGHVFATARKGSVVSVSRDGDFYGGLRRMVGMDVHVTPVPVVPDPPRNTAPVDDPKAGVAIETGPLTLPNERTGVLLVFRAFDRISYGIVMRATRPMFVGDLFMTP